MVVYDPRVYFEILELNKDVVDRHVEGLSHADSLITPVNGGNCLNWVLGHIIENRNELLEAVGHASVWSQFEKEIYQSGSEWMTPDASTVNLSELIRFFGETQTKLVDWLKTSTIDSIKLEVKFGTQLMETGQLLNLYFWHETYHLGQFELLRRLAGKLEKIYE